MSDKSIEILAKNISSLSLVDLLEKETINTTERFIHRLGEIKCRQTMYNEIRGEKFCILGKFCPHSLDHSKHAFEYIHLMPEVIDGFIIPDQFMSFLRNGILIWDDQANANILP